MKRIADFQKPSDDQKVKTLFVKSKTKNTPHYCQFQNLTRRNDFWKSYVLGKAMKSSPLLGPFCDSKF